MLEKIAAWANIVALILGIYGGYGTYQLLHPNTPAPVAQVAAPTTNGATMVNATAVLSCLLAAAALIIIAGVLNFIAARKRPAPQGSLQLTTGAGATGSLAPATSGPAGNNPPAPTFNAAAFFNHAYTSQIVEQTKDNVRAAAEQNRPADRESFYVDMLGIGIAAYIYDMIWAYAYKSQIQMLTELVRRFTMPLSEVKAYYDKAAAEYPDIYKTYTFDGWMAWLKSQLLLIHHPTDMIEGTLRARDFLKYLAHWGRDANQKNG